MREAVGRCFLVTDEQGMAPRLRWRPGCWRPGRTPRVREMWWVGVRRHVVEVHVAVSVLIGVYGHRHSAVICGDGFLCA